MGTCAACGHVDHSVIAGVVGPCWALVEGLSGTTGRPGLCPCREYVALVPVNRDARARDYQYLLERGLL